MMRLTLSAVTCFLLLMNAWADDKDDAKKEVEKFQGEWKLTAMEEIILKINGTDYEFNGGGMTEKGKFKFNPSAKPAEVDVDIKEGTDAGKKQVGIYEIKEGKLKFCFARAGETERPKKFEGAEDGSRFVFEFEKVKK